MFPGFLFSRRRVHRALFTLIGALLSALPANIAFAQTTIHIPADQPTIQAGINAAHNGDTVLVAPGTYYENIDFLGKAITVTSSAGAANTTIDGGLKASAVVFTHGETQTSVLSNFTITNGQGGYAGALGGIYLSWSSPTIRDNTITKNQCYGINAQYSSALIQHNEISYTQAKTFECGFGSGAGIWSLSYSGIAPLVVIGNTIEQNTQSGLEDAGGNGGAGIAAWYGPIIIEDNIIRNNATGKYFSPAGGGEGGAILFWGPSTALVLNNLVYGNTSNLDGGGIKFNGFLGGAPTVTLINNTIVDNAVVPVSTFSQVVNGGQQIYYDAGQGSHVQFLNNVISGSTAGASVVCYDEAGASIVYQNNDFYNAAGPATASLNGGTCAFPVGSSGNLSVLPGFLQPSTPDYHLQAGSPLIDSGSNAALATALSLGGSVLVDADGNPRLLNGSASPAAPIVDIGAYEYQNGVNGPPTTTALTSTPNPSIYSQAVTFLATVTVTSSPSSPLAGTVTFSSGATILGSAMVGSQGVASLPVSNLPIGSDLVTATFVPSGNFGYSAASLTQQVLSGYPTSTSVTSSLNPSAVSQSVTFTATVAAQSSANGTPTGSVAFSDGATVLGSQPLASGKATLTTSALTRGPHTITATYVPNGSFGGSSNSLVQTVNGLPDTAALTVTPPSITYGSPITLTASVTAGSSGTPTGIVTFYEGGSTLGTASLSNSISSLQLVSPAGGPHTYTCSYSGDATFNPSSCAPVAYTIAPVASMLTLTSNANPVPALANTTFVTATLSTNGIPLASAPITLAIDGNVYTTGNTSPTGLVYAPAALIAGTHNITASYAGDASHLPSNASLTETVVANPTTTALTAAPNPAVQNQTVTLVATIQANTGTERPYGHLTISDAGTQIYGTILAPGVTTTASVSFPVSTLGVGTHALTAIYTPSDSNFIDSTSAPVSLVVTPADAVLTTDHDTLAMQTEHHGSIGISIASIGGLTGTFNLACGPMPAWAACYFGSSTLALPANGKIATTLEIDTDAVRDFKSSLTPPGKPGSPVSKLPLFALAPIALLALGSRRRRASTLHNSLRCTAALSVCLAIAGSITGCGDKYPSHTEPGSYTVQVTAMAVAGTTPIPMSRTATFTLQVTQ